MEVKSEWLKTGTSSTVKEDQFHTIPPRAAANRQPQGHGDRADSTHLQGRRNEGSHDKHSTTLTIACLNVCVLKSKLNYPEFRDFDSNVRV